MRTLRFILPGVGFFCFCSIYIYIGHFGVHPGSISIEQRHNVSETLNKSNDVGDIDLDPGFEQTLPQIIQIETAVVPTTIQHIVANSSRKLRLHRHILIPFCGTRSDFLEQAVRLLKSIILTQTSKYSKGNFNWDVWMLLDDAAMRMISPQVNELLPLAAGTAIGPQVIIHLLEIEPLKRQYGRIVKRLHPNFQCFSYWLFTADVLPHYVDQVIVFAADEVVVDDLELLLENALHMGWSNSKLFAFAEERIKHGIFSAHIHSVPNLSLHKVRHRFFLSGVNTGSFMFSLKNSRKYALAKWLTELFERFHPSSFGLADQDIVNRYGMEHPERISLLQCNVDVRGIGSCDTELHAPIVLHGTGQRFARKARFRLLGTPAVASEKDRKFWLPLANAVDKVFAHLRSEGHESLPGSSIWEAVGPEVRLGIVRTIGFHRNLPGAMSPKIDLPPIGPMTDTSNFQSWRATYLEKVFNVTNVFANMPTETWEMYMARKSSSELYWASIRR